MRWQLFSGIVVLLLVGLVRTQASDEDDFDTDDITVGENVKIKVEQAAAPQMAEYKSPYATPGKFFFAEHFDNVVDVNKRWVRSQAKKDDTEENIAKYDGVWEVESPQRPILDGDLGLVLKSKAKHAAIAARLNKPFVFSDKPLVVQYEVTLQDGQECGGSYIKLLSSGKETTDLTKFNDKTPYTIMFGPDKCGNDIKLHFIFRHTNPRNGTVTEKHCKKSKDRLEEPFKDKQPHLYQLILRPDNTFEIRVDHKLINEGSLLTTFDPPVNPPREIDDPSDAKPADWDEREKIADPDSKKPEDWDEDELPQIPDPSASKPEDWLDDEEEMIADPTAVKPEDWDNEIDGEWEAPLITNPVCEKAVGCGMWQAPVINNPNYKGKWRAPLIDNPNYQGKWAPKKINNPDFFEDLLPFKMTTIAAVGIELWSMSNEILFDNIVITDNVATADEWAAQTYDVKREQIEKEAVTLWGRMMKYMNYKPGWWASYFVYCMIPIVIYGWYLYRRCTEEETLVTRLKKYTEENPWMWGVYVVVIGLPLALAIFFLCSSSSKDKPNESHPKKTDEHQLDDDEMASGDSPAAGTSKGAIKKQGGGKSSKADLNTKATIEEEEPSSSQGDEEVEEELLIDDEPETVAAPEEEEEVVATKNAPRKRKQRKD